MNRTYLLQALLCLCAVSLSAQSEIAILQEDFPPRESYADPLELNNFLASKHAAVRLISSEELSREEFLQPEKIEAVILPYGACFPFEARDVFVHYLKRGGSFVSMGGYAFDDLMKKENGSWVKFETDDLNLLLSGRRGQPGDWVRFQPEQIVIFDPTYPFKRVETISPDPQSPLSVGDWSYTMPLEGFAATAMSGGVSPVFPDAYADWHPLVTSYDRFGRPRGSVFSVMVHHDGPYQGSKWAFSGATNVNLFSKSHPEMMEALWQTIQFMQNPERKKPAVPSPSLPSATYSKITFSNNYFQVNGEPTILFGCNQTGMVWYSPRENAETWERDFSRMRVYGMRVLRILHFSPFAARGYEGRAGHSAMDLAKRPPAKLIEQTDQLVQIAGKFGVALILTLHDWLDVELSDEELEAQRTWCRFWTNHYKESPHVFFDIQNEPSVLPGESSINRTLWNRFLQETYRTDSAVKEAWGKYAADETLGSIPCQAGAEEWDNPRAFDYNRFRVWLVERWINANMEGIKSGNPEAIGTVGFLQSEWQADKFLPTGRLDFSNTHYHGPFDRFSPIFKLTDRRFRGQGLSVGEFGGWDAHEARKKGLFQDEVRSSIHHFLAVGHETLGLGGGMALNWDLKDLDDCVFPWGLTYAQDAVPKDWFYAYRNMSYFFRSFRPCYEAPDVFFVLPDNHRLGAKIHVIHRAMRAAMDQMFSCHVNFGVINEKDLFELPQSAKHLLWPIPYCPDDDVFEFTVNFVKEGGNLYFSGGIGFDAAIKPTRIKRYAQLGLKEQEPKDPFQIDIPKEKQDFIVSKVGKGSVYFLPAPIELAEMKDLSWNPYKEFFHQAGYAGIEAQPDDPLLHLFSIPETNGRRIYTLYRNDRASEPADYEIQTIGGRIALSLGPWETGLVEIDEQGRIFSIEGTGSIQQNQEPLVETDAHLMIQSADGRPIGQSQRICLFPTRGGMCSIWNEALKDPQLIAGEIVNGEWKTHEALNLKKDDKRLHLNIDEDRTYCMLIIKEKSDEFTLSEF
ncbi:MAG: cellulase family glycosylhydrolase [Candidatus Omnitrophica bacterium]|nr:cellulase family glycosylhydrolase [Candidatus Omnitrophota bacterium]